MKVCYLNGPNLNLLGTRQPEIYGSKSLSDIAEMIRQRAAERNVEVGFRQSNSEGQLVDWIHEVANEYDYLVLNAAAYTHTSVAYEMPLRALRSPRLKFIYRTFMPGKNFAIRRSSRRSALAKSRDLGSNPMCLPSRRAFSYAAPKSNPQNSLKPRETRLVVKTSRRATAQTTSVSGH